MRTNDTNAMNYPYTDMVSVISRTLAAANHLISKLLADNGMTNLIPSHGDIFLQLFSCDEITMASLADAIGKDPSTVTSLVKKLVDGGYVKTEKSSEDRRITQVSLTDSGRALEKSFLQVSQRLLNAMTSNLTEQDLVRTKESLLTMKKSFEQEAEEE